ncbi:MAG: Na+/H+ antiporter NhaA [Steroidobacteraceae bacterium]
MSPESPFQRFLRSEQAGAFLLMGCTVVALVCANSVLAPAWLGFWHHPVWLNDGLMAVFFLLIGLELRRELREGELSSRDRALLPAVAAVGGMAAPALIHFALNAGTPEVRGFGIPMATDIAFTLGVLGLLGRRIPLALRVFVVAFAVIDDLGAILVIALFYSGSLSVPHLASVAAVWLAMVALGRLGGVRRLEPFLVLAVVLWWLMLQSGVHATLAGVFAAFAIPYESGAKLEHGLSRPVAFVILPLFALGNAGVVLAGGPAALASANGLGIIAGLTLGKPVGIALASVLASRVLGLRLPAGIGVAHLIGAGLLGGIGFTMSIFIVNLAFGAVPELVNASKLAVLAASVISAALGAVWLMSIPRAASR